MFWLPVLLASVLAGPPVQATVPSTWQAQVSIRVAARDLEGAMTLVKERLLAAPDDEDAQFWQARLSAWLGRWTEAEREYRALVTRSPRNADYLLGLAGVRLAQQQPLDALGLIDQAHTLDRQRADVVVARGRALRMLGRIDDARDAFQAALDLAPGDEEALAGARSVRPDPPHRLTSGADVDHYSFADTGARALTHELRSTWTTKWASHAGARVDRRANMTAWRLLGAVSWRPAARAAITAGGSAGAGKGVVSNQEFFVDAGLGVPLNGGGRIRGFELNYEQRWLSFDEALVVTARPTVVVYLPREWRATFSVAVARSAFEGLGAEWRPSTSARVSFPVTAAVSGHGFLATGTENFALRDQIGRFSARTAGGGVRISLPGGQDVSFYLARQWRDQGRVQTSVGVWHGVRF